MTDPRAATSHGLVGRDRALGLACELLFSIGADVEIVGPRHSGRSSMADAISAAATQGRRTAVRVHGVRSLRTTPLAALHAAGFGTTSAPERRASSPLQHAIEALTAAVAGGGAVILVDDADLLDDASTGALDAVRRATGVPVLRTRTRLAHASATSYVVELLPLSYDELTSVVIQKLDGPVHAGAMSRLYALTGGNVGLALSTARLAIVEGALTRRAGVWSATSDLWSPSLRGLALDHIADLAPEERSALESIAVAEAADAASARDQVDAAVVRGLEAAGVITTLAQPGRHRIVLDPPLLCHHFRHDAGTKPSEEAVFVRLVHEDADDRRSRAAAEWRRAPTPRAALALARALMPPAGAIPGTEAELDAVLSASTSLADDPLVVVGLAELCARRALAAGHGLSRAVAVLRDRLSTLTHPYARVADAACALLAVEVGAAAGVAADRLEDDPALPEEVRARLLHAAQAVAIQRGRFDDALALHERLRSLPPTEVAAVADAVHGLALLGSGRHADSIAWAARGSADARARLDVAALRLHSLVAGLAHLVSGRADDASAAIATASALGAPPVPGSAVECGLRGLAALIAARRGDVALTERIRDQLAGEPGARSAAGRAALEWIDAQLAAAQGRPDDAAAVLRRLAKTFRSSGQESAAAFALLTALEHSTLEHSAAEDGLKEAQALLAGQQSGLHEARLAAVVSRGHRETSGFFSAPVPLTDRERDIVRLVAEGLVYREIATKLHLSARTVEGIAARVIRKLGLRDRRELAQFGRSRTL